MAGAVRERDAGVLKAAAKGAERVRHAEPTKFLLENHLPQTNNKEGATDVVYGSLLAVHSAFSR